MTHAKVGAGPSLGSSNTPRADPVGRFDFPSNVSCVKRNPEMSLSRRSHRLRKSLASRMSEPLGMTAITLSTRRRRLVA